ncbi:MAG: terminase family protein [Candidatus Bathyarchaeia archaeon]
MARFCRQSGKTTVIAVKALWYALTHPATTTLIVTPSLRQSGILMNRVVEMLKGMESKLMRIHVAELLKSQVRFRNGSNIKALPCSYNLLKGFTASLIIVDEAAFFRDDEHIFYTVLLPMLATTNGSLIVSSTPWGRNTVFYRMNQDESYSRHVATWRDAVEAGIINPEFMEEMRRIFPPERFRREFEAQFAEDVNAYFPQDLIARCVDNQLDYLSLEAHPRGEFYVGVDFGKRADHSAVAVINCKDGVKRLIHIRRFPIETPYRSVIGYVKRLSLGYRDVHRILCDQTGVGEYIVEEMRGDGIGNVEGILLTLQRKEEILSYLKQEMLNGQLLLPYDPELIAEINVEEYELTKDGRIKFSHPEGSHDDQLWALALAAYASRGNVDKTRPLSLSF